MKKKLLTSAAIASFLTAAGVVIPQTDIFAVDTPNTPHPSTLSNEQPSENTNSTENNGLVKEWNKIYDKKKVDSFADYWIESITRDKNYLTIKTKDHNSVDYVHYVDAEKIPTQWDAPGAHMLNATKIADDLYRVDTNELVKGENENKKFILNAISLVPDYSDDKNNSAIQNSYILKKFKDSNGNIMESFAYAAVEELDFKDLHKYADITQVVGPKATVENKQKLPEVGDKDYVVYTDKSQVELNGTIKTTIKYKPGAKKYSDVLIEKYIGKASNGLQGFENIWGYNSKDFGISFANDKDEKDDKELNLPGWYSMDSEGNDVFYTWLKGMAPGHYHITKLFGLDLTKGNLDNSEFTIGENEKFVYRTESDSTKPKDSNPIIEPPPLEGFWWQEGIEGVDYRNKQNFKFISLIRMPDFVTKEVFEWAIKQVTEKKKEDFSKVEFFSYDEGICVQCMHIGPYDKEPETVAKMHKYMISEGYELDINEIRFHHEIYISDVRKTAPEKLKTIIRHPIRKK